MKMLAARYLDDGGENLGDLVVEEKGSKNNFERVTLRVKNVRLLLTPLMSFRFTAFNKTL